MGDSLNEKSESSDTHIGRLVQIQDIDAAAGVDLDKPLEPELALRLRRRIDLRLMPLMCTMYLMVFAEKTTLSNSAVLGILQSAHLTQNQFSWLGTIFYLSYLVFQYPQNLALQKFPVGKWMSINIFIWAVALLSHVACKSFGALFVVRVVLGACEGAFTPGFMIVNSMFYTHAEQNKRMGYCLSMNGFAIIFLGFISFGIIHSKASNFMPWQWLMVITGLLALVTAVLFWFLLPDSPTTAYFLTPEERLQAIQRIKINQNGVENKHWNREQFVETLCDPKVWLMALFAAVHTVINSLAIQRQIIIEQFGFTLLQTTWLGCVEGVVIILVIWFGVTLASFKLVGRGYACVMMSVLALVGSILVSTLPSENKIGLLFSYWSTMLTFAPFAIFLGWAGTIVSGHTKKTTTNAIVLIGYGIGNSTGPLMWRQNYQPRYHIPWAILSACIFTDMLLILLLRFTLAKENGRRDAKNTKDSYDVCVTPEEHSDGSNFDKKVDSTFLDLTDIQNQEFRYVL